MDNFKFDGRKWKFLDSPDRYDSTREFKPEPLRRQFRTAKEILERFKDGNGVLLADDVGLGKTMVGALVAWIVACQAGRVRIYAPNDVLRRRWAEELERHVPMLQQLGGTYKNVKNEQIRQGAVERLRAGSIHVTTHYALVKSYGKNEQRTTCDLMIIDEAHRAKSDGSKFNEALRILGDYAERKLILTATPFSINISELKQLLQFVGAFNTELKAAGKYADTLKDLYTLGDGHDVSEESERLVSAARAAIDELAPYLIRHGIDDLKPIEQKCFGTVSETPWDIPVDHATHEDLELLLRMDRLLQLSERKGGRRNDPRFHIGWQHADTELKRAKARINSDAEHAMCLRHIDVAEKALALRLAEPHPKIAAVSKEIRLVIDGGEKVLVFCHHRATASELLCWLEQLLKIDNVSWNSPPKEIWRDAWEILWCDDDLQLRNNPLLEPIIEWLCSKGIRWQISGWIGEPAARADKLADQIKRMKPRKVKSRKDVCGIPTIFGAARILVRSLLAKQSKSTLAVLRNMKKAQLAESHFPGKLDDGFRVMGAWDSDGHDAPKTLYTGKPDIVLALFNSPFGPDVLVTTDRLSEGVDLHRYCRHLIHYELDPSPVRTIQRNGRIRRVDSWAALTGQPIRYAYPIFGGTRDEKAVGIMAQRINAFGLLLGGVPPLDDDPINSEQSFTEKIIGVAQERLKPLNRKLALS
jgi:superfamily II DNA or RNA helicase